MQYKIIVDKQPSSNPSSEKKEYIVDIEELRVKGDVYDSLVITKDEDYVMRRLSLSEYGVLSVLEQEVKEPLENINIELFEGDNYVYLMDMQGNKFYAEYLIKNDFNDIYVNRNEMNSEITQTAQSIELSVNQKLESYSTTQEMNSTIEQTAQNITSTVNQTLTNYATADDLEEQVAELNSTITQTANSINFEVSKKVGANEVCSVISQSADEISLKGNRVIIESDNFNLDKNGNMTCENATMSSANIIDGSINFSAKGNNVIQVHRADDDTERIYISENYIGVQLSGHKDIVIIGNLSRNEGIISLSGNGTTTLLASGIETPNVTQTSLEESKKNISKVKENALDIVNNAEIYNYNLKIEKNTDKKHYGFVIGDNYKTPREVISKKGQAIEHGSAIGILWKAVQELSAKIEKLEKEAQNG